MKKRKSAEIEKYIRACAKAFEFSGVILVAKGGKVLWSGAVGFANREHKVLNTTKTKFRLASITKSFTAVAIFMLQERGLLKVSDPICKHLKKAPKSWKNITVFHLLTHTSGIPSYTDFPDHVDIMRKRLTPTELIETFKDKKLDFAPGEKFHYCNSGYILLGIIIETLSGKTYEQFLRDEVFKKLGMDETGLDDNNSILANRAQGYTRSVENKLRNAEFIDMSIPFAAGGLYSTAEDLFKFEKGLEKRKVLSKASMTQMTEPPENETYACGWATTKCGKHVVTGHAGGINGFATNFERIDSEDYCSIVLSNIQAAPVNMVADTLRAIVFEAPYTVPRTFKEIQIKAKILSDYEGQFELSPDFIITVSAEGGTLFAQATGQPKLTLKPHAKDKFFFVQVYAQISFKRNDAGKISKMVLHQNGADHVAKRVGK